MLRTKGTAPRRGTLPPGSRPPRSPRSAQRPRAAPAPPPLAPPSGRRLALARAALRSERLLPSVSSSACRAQAASAGLGPPSMAGAAWGEAFFGLSERAVGRDERNAHTAPTCWLRLNCSRHSPLRPRRPSFLLQAFRLFPCQSNFIPRSPRASSAPTVPAGRRAPRGVTKRLRHRRTRGELPRAVRGSAAERRRAVPVRAVQVRRGSAATCRGAAGGRGAWPGAAPCLALPHPPGPGGFAGKFDASPGFFIGTGKKKKKRRKERRHQPKPRDFTRSLPLPVISQNSWISCCCCCRLRRGKEASGAVPAASRRRPSPHGRSCASIRWQRLASPSCRAPPTAGNARPATESLNNTPRPGHGVGSAGRCCSSSRLPDAAPRCPWPFGRSGSPCAAPCSALSCSAATATQLFLGHSESFLSKQNILGSPNVIIYITQLLPYSLMDFS